MSLILRQSTAVDVLIGPFLDDTDAATAEEAISPSVLLSKNGQALGAANDGTVAHDDAGYYNCQLDATDTNTVGTLVLIVEADGTALPVRHEFQVVEESTYDFLFVSGADPDADVAAILADTNELQSDDYPTSIAAVQTTADAIETDTQDIQGRLPAALTANGNIKASVQEFLTTALTETAGQITAAFKKFFDVATPTGTVNSLPDAAPDAAGGLIVSDTGELDADAMAASVAAIETDTSTTLDNLVDDLESRLGTPSDFGSGTSTIAANLQDLADNGTATYDRSTDSLQALRDHIGDGTNLTEAGGTGDQLTAITGAISGLNDPTAAAVASAVWSAASRVLTANTNFNDPTAASIADAICDELLSGHTTAGTLAKAIADIESDATAILADTNELQSDDIPGLIAALNDPTVAAIADAVWEELIADHSGTSGSTAESLDTAATSSSLSADDVWDEAIEGSYTARQLIRGIVSIAFAKVSGMDNNAPIFRDLSDTKNRISATTNGSGNRTAVTINDLT